MKPILHFLICFSLFTLSNKSFGQKILASFEDEGDLKNLSFTHGVEVSRSTDFAALQSYSCKAVFPEKGGTFYLNKIEPFYENSIEGNNLGKDEVLHFLVFPGSA